MTVNPTDVFDCKNKNRSAPCGCTEYWYDLRDPRDLRNLGIGDVVENQI